MAVPALVLPKRWFPEALTPEVLQQIENKRPERDELIVEVQRTRPKDGSPEEAEALLRLMRLTLPLASDVAVTLFDTFRGGIEAGLAELVAKEREGAEPARQVALRHVEHSIHTFGVIIESWAHLMRSVPPATLELLFGQFNMIIEDGHLPMSEDERIILRFELDLMVALECIDQDLETLAYWALRAVTGSRRIEAMPSPKLPAALRGELARARARLSWKDWDDQESRREFARWP